ncbi:MAG: response regulator [Gammaproteobacteria bacterium]|nr:response regulator [Gammaproteobacteria bacterium]
MSEQLDRIARHVNRLLARQVRPLFIALDDKFRLHALRGDAEYFGYRHWRVGDPVGDRLPLLATLDPAKATPQVWRFVQLPDMPTCHVHLIALDDAWGVALLDATAEHTEQQQRQQIAHEMLLLRDERERLLTELDRANRLKGEFIARMSHEFRTPLAAVIGYGEQLRDSSEDERTQQQAGAVLRSGRYLLNLVDNLLGQAQIDNERLHIDAAACDLGAACDEVEQLLRPLAEQKSLSFAWWFDGDIPTRVWLDATRLQQVLLNLVGNAIKFTESGNINVEFDWQEDRLHVSVADSGPGIAEHQQAHIFEPFHQGASAQHGKGAGLGLSISRALVTAMGGELELVSSGANGSRFAFSITAPAVRSGRRGDDALSGRKVLLADDDQDLLDLFALYLKAAGCAVHCVSDAAQVRVAARTFKPDAVVVDLNLGDRDGLTLARELRESGYRHGIAVLSASEAGSVQRTEPAVDAYWRKPIGRVQLLDGIAALISGQ